MASFSVRGPFQAPVEKMPAGRIIGNQRRKALLEKASWPSYRSRVLRVCQQLLFENVCLFRAALGAVCVCGLYLSANGTCWGFTLLSTMLGPI